MDNYVFEESNESNDNDSVNMNNNNNINVKGLIRMSKRTWTTDEDQLIIDLVKNRGLNWAVVSSHFPNRSGKQCRERYKNHLRTDIKKGGWTLAEDKIIMDMVADYGNAWVKIKKHLSGRTDNAIKNRYHAILRAQNAKYVGGSGIYTQRYVGFKNVFVDESTTTNANTNNTANGSLSARSNMSEDTCTTTDTTETTETDYDFEHMTKLDTLNIDIDSDNDSPVSVCTDHHQHNSHESQSQFKFNINCNYNNQSQNSSSNTNTNTNTNCNNNTSDTRDTSDLCDLLTKCASIEEENYVNTINAIECVNTNSNSNGSNNNSATNSNNSTVYYKNDCGNRSNNIYSSTGNSTISSELAQWKKLCGAVYTDPLDSEISGPDGIDANTTSNSLDGIIDITHTNTISTANTSYIPTSTTVTVADNLFSDIPMVDDNENDNDMSGYSEFNTSGIGSSDNISSYNNGNDNVISGNDDNNNGNNGIVNIPVYATNMNNTVMTISGTTGMTGGAMVPTLLSIDIPPVHILELQSTSESEPVQVPLLGLEVDTDVDVYANGIGSLCGLSGVMTHTPYNNTNTTNTNKVNTHLLSSPHSNCAIIDKDNQLKSTSKYMQLQFASLEWNLKDFNLNLNSNLNSKKVSESDRTDEYMKNPFSMEHKKRRYSY